MILHIVGRAEWNDAQQRGQYAPPPLRAEGFIHCSTLDQLLDTANRFFSGQSDLVVLSIDERRLVAPLRYEAPAIALGERCDERFPHLYGPLNLDAVTRVVDFPSEPDGSFRLPAALCPAA